MRRHKSFPSKEREKISGSNPPKIGISNDREIAKNLSRATKKALLLVKSRIQLNLKANNTNRQKENQEIITPQKEGKLKEEGKKSQEIIAPQKEGKLQEEKESRTDDDDGNTLSSHFDWESQVIIASQKEGKFKEEEKERRIDDDDESIVSSYFDSLNSLSLQKLKRQNMLDYDSNDFPDNSCPGLSEYFNKFAVTRVGNDDSVCSAPNCTHSGTNPKKSGKVFSSSVSCMPSINEHDIEYLKPKPTCARDNISRCGEGEIDIGSTGNDEPALQKYENKEELNIGELKNGKISARKKSPPFIRFPSSVEDNENTSQLNMVKILKMVEIMKKIDGRNNKGIYHSECNESLLCMDKTINNLGENVAIVIEKVVGAATRTKSKQKVPHAHTEDTQIPNASEMEEIMREMMVTEKNDATEVSNQTTTAYHVELAKIMAEIEQDTLISDEMFVRKNNLLHKQLLLVEPIISKLGKNVESLIENTMKVTNSPTINKWVEIPV
eukprot:CAMPEP_0194293682 /NCGR_PEP_ID=MMETSP0169-20130528/48403_1 /TAXON_ID=218684 /ORGANISM="Corethron pennatum, Strain L29A3" /LENGTH=495 /DNA_ID=CAMNT_0039042273 /DNA_START=222 /DNA_END=1705 /DNA_ORIENTATION=-